MSGTGALANGLPPEGLASRATAPRMMSASMSFRGNDKAGHASLSFCPTRGCEPAVEAERAAAIDHVRRKIETVKARSGWTIPVEEAGHLVRILDELAEDLGRGLHLQ